MRDSISNWISLGCRLLSFDGVTSTRKPAGCEELERLLGHACSGSSISRPSCCPGYAAGLSLGSGNNRQIYIRSNENTLRTALTNEQFRWNAIAAITVAELLHHSKSSGMFSDPELDKAALTLLSGDELDKAKATMTKKDYAPGSVAHTLVKTRCKSTNRYGAPPER